MTYSSQWAVRIWGGIKLVWSTVLLKHTHGSGSSAPIILLWNHSHSISPSANMMQQNKRHGFEWPHTLRLCPVSAYSGFHLSSVVVIHSFYSLPLHPLSTGLPSTQPMIFAALLLPASFCFPFFPSKKAWFSFSDLHGWIFSSPLGMNFPRV